MRAEISYGKMQIPLYRTYARAMSGVAPIPESAFTGRENILFAVEVGVEVFGDNFMPAYTEGDNRNVVATDTMKNFVLREALEFDGSTLEGFLYFLSRRFLTTYPQMQALQLTGKELPFQAAQVPAAATGPRSPVPGPFFRQGFDASGVLFGRSNDSYAHASLDMKRVGDQAGIIGHRCGCAGLQLIKITGSSFANFARDEYTTLPERVDRPLFTHLNVSWRYADPVHMVAADLANYIAAEQVRDFVHVTFHDFISMSIQHLIYEIGTRLLRRFPQMQEVSFQAQNRLWDTAFVSEEDPRIKVYTDPRPPYGCIQLTLTREEGS